MLKKKTFGMITLTVGVILAFTLVGCDTGNGNDVPGDTTAPILSLQAVAEYESTIDGTTSTVLFTSNEAGTYYVKVLTSSIVTPSVSELAESAINGAVMADTAKKISITGLTANTSYKAYVTVKDTAGNYSAVWSSDAFTPTQGTVSNPFIGTWTHDNPGGFNDEIKVVCTATTWEVYITQSTQGISDVKFASGTYTYIGNPATWTVDWILGWQHTDLRVGHVGVAMILSATQIGVGVFSDENANGTYTKQTP